PFAIDGLCLVARKRGPHPTGRPLWIYLRCRTAYLFCGLCLLHDIRPWAHDPSGRAGLAHKAFPQSTLSPGHNSGRFADPKGGSRYHDLGSMAQMERYVEWRGDPALFCIDGGVDCKREEEMLVGGKSN